LDINREKDILHRARKDPHAFTPVFDEYYPKIVKYAFFRTGNAAAAADIA